VAGAACGLEKLVAQLCRRRGSSSVQQNTNPVTLWAIESEPIDGNVAEETFKIEAQIAEL
jgi:hypothetical protein